MSPVRSEATLGQVAIVGAGQVGTMLGMALSGPAPVTEVGLADRDPSRLRESMARGAGQRALGSVEEVLGSDVIILAMPIREIVGWIEAHGADLRPGSFVIDTGSAKRRVVEAMADHVATGAGAMGGHPMTGTEIPGPAGARPELLKGAPFVLSPVRDDRAALDTALRLVEALGSEPVEMDAEAHDRVVARTSHVPHLVAAALALVAREAGSERASAVTGPGLAGATRLAASDPEVTASFLAANADEVHLATGELIDMLRRLSAAAAGGPRAVADLLAVARTARQDLTT
jgi:prephenate dehydrogenase